MQNIRGTRQTFRYKRKMQKEKAKTRMAKALIEELRSKYANMEHTETKRTR